RPPDGDVLRRRDDRDGVTDLGPDALVALPNLVRRQRYASSLVSQAFRTQGDLQPLSNVSCARARHSLHASRLPVPPRREEQLGVARGAEVEPLDPCDTGLPQRSFCGLPEVELPAAHDPAAKALAVRGGDFLADLVAAGADRRPDRRGHPPTERGHAPLDDAGEQPDPPRMQTAARRRGSVLAGERDRQAVGGERQDGQPRLIGPEPVALDAASLALLSAVDELGVNLVVEREPRGLGADLGASPPAVLVDALDIIAGLAPEVQRRVRAFADAA